MRLAKVQLVVLLAALSSGGCQSPVESSRNESSSVRFNAPGGGSLTPEQGQRAAQLYLTTCARCHKLYDSRRYSEAEWRSWMHKMSRKARLTPEEENLLSEWTRPGPLRSTEPPESVNEPP
jgi:hypothetical protein